MVQDLELACAAQAGDQDALAVLISQHMAGLRAVAIAILGYGDEADDAVQDAILIALSKFSQLRDVSAADAWLRAVVRNASRRRLLARRTIPVADMTEFVTGGELGPDKIMERAETADWVQHAVATLPIPIREMVVLRYFTAFSSYAQIAELCGVPISTVRKGLWGGRQALERALRTTTEAAYAGGAAAAEATRSEARATVEAILRADDEFERMVHDRFDPAALISVSGNRLGGPAAMIDLFCRMLTADVRLRYRDASASSGIMVWETEFINPPHDPDHCPPAMAWLFRVDDGRVRTLRLSYRHVELS
ncbi:RNA polymerase sigma factor [Virgisporangium aliadipatigenens]|nr:RNA polymerase sigma factor [Virgisporangium aliadipatigenens]